MSAGARRGLHVRLPEDLAAWLDEESERRVVHRNLLLVRAVELLQEAVAVAPDLVELPEGFRPRIVVDTSGGAAR